jgi:hypothetical protein
MTNHKNTTSTPRKSPAARIAKLEAELADLAAESVMRIDELEARLEDLTTLFAALCYELNAQFPLQYMPLRLQFAFEQAAERFGVTRSWVLGK